MPQPTTNDKKVPEVPDVPHFSNLCNSSKKLIQKNTKNNNSVKYGTYGTNGTNLPKVTSEQIKNEAIFFHKLGLAVIPFHVFWNEKKQRYEKKNLGYWGKWQTKKQTDEEFNGLQWANANAYGVLLGQKANNGLYLSVLDYDIKGEVSEEVKQKGREILKEFTATRIERTINNGLHHVFWSKKKVNTDGTFHDNAGIELLGTKKLCLFASSYGYKKLNDNQISTIEDLETKFYTILKKHGFTKNEETETSNQIDRSSFNIKELVDLSKLKKQGDEYQGSHPIHDSTTEQNFCVNPTKNTWHCFRHNSGGGALQYLAVKEGLLACEDAQKGALKGKLFNKVLKIAVAQGLITEKILSQSTINPILLAKDIQEDYKFVTDKEANELFFYQEEKGVYSNKIEQLLRREIAKRLNENFKNRYYTEIYEFIRATAPLVEMNKTDPELLVVENGILNVLTNEKTDFTPDNYTTIKTPIIYDKKIKYDDSYNKKFLEQVVQDSKQRRQIQEHLGHCLYRKIITETCLVCLGKGGNGKTILLMTIRGFLGGSKNVSSITIQSLCYDRFKAVELKGKLANISPDLPQKALFNTGTYKALVSGEEVAVSVKHVQGKGESFKNSAKFLYSANGLPPVEAEEDCYAWYRRFCFADFKITFSNNSNGKNIQKQIPRQELLAKLNTPEEYSALLNWSLEGLQRLIKNGDITDKPNVDEIRKEYRRKSSSTLAYFDECIKITNSPDDVLWTEDWYREYVTYCHKNELKPQLKGKFIETAEQNLPGIRKGKIRKTEGKNPTSAWRYVKTIIEKTESEKLQELAIFTKDKIRENKNNPEIKLSIITEKIKELQFKDNVETVLKHLKKQVPELSIINDLSIGEMLGGAD